MHHRLHRDSRPRAEASVALLTVLAALGAIRLGLGGYTTSALAAGAFGLAVLVHRLVRGPGLGPGVIEITDDELVFILHFYIPTRTLRFPLARLRAVRVIGPSPGRRFRLELDDGSREDVRPFFGPFLVPRAIDFLRSHLPPHVEVVVEKPAGMMAQVRGEF